MVGASLCNWRLEGSRALGPRCLLDPAFPRSIIVLNGALLIHLYDMGISLNKVPLLYPK